MGNCCPKSKVVNYIGVFRDLQEALVIYGSGFGGGVISVISYQLSSTQTINRGALIAEFFFPRIIDGLYPVSFLVINKTIVNFEIPLNPPFQGGKGRSKQ